MKRTSAEMISDEEVERTIELLREVLCEHDENRVRVQEELDEVRIKMTKQLDDMVNNVNTKLEKHFKKEDDEIQEALSEIMALSIPEDKRDEAQKLKLAELMKRAKAILLIKRSYEITKSKKPKKETPKLGGGFNGGGNDFGGGFNGGGNDFGGGFNGGGNDFGGGFNGGFGGGFDGGFNGGGGFGGGFNGGQPPRPAADEDTEIDLSNMYDLSVKSEIGKECFCTRKPSGVEVSRVHAGRIYLAFEKLFNEEEEKILSEHNLLDSITYKAAICKDGSDKWDEYNLTKNDNNSSSGEKDEYSFSHALLDGTTFTVKMCWEIGGNRSEWSECASFVPKFSEACGWMEDPTINKGGKERYYLHEDNPMAVTVRTVGGKMKIVSNISLPQNKVTSWSFKIVTISENEHSLPVLGVLPLDDEDIVGQMHNHEDTCWGINLRTSMPSILSRGRIEDKDNACWIDKRLKSGDVVGIVMDTTKGELSIVLNGVNLGVAHEGIPLDKPLVPCAILGHPGDSIELDLSEVKGDVVDTSIGISNATAKSDEWDSIILTWDAVEKASFYQIEADENKFWYMSKTNTFTKTGLLPNTEHTFRVRVVRGSSVSEWSDVVKGRTTILPDFSESVWKKPQNRAPSQFPMQLQRQVRSPIDESNPRVLTNHASDSSLTATSNIMLQPGKVTSWSIKILSPLTPALRNDFGDFGPSGKLLIGVAPLLSTYSNMFSPNGWFLNCKTFKLEAGAPHNVFEKEYGPRKEDGKYVQEGDTIGVIMDMAKGELSFVVDGENLGVAFEGIPLDKPLAPAVFISNGGDSVELDPAEVRLCTVSSAVRVPANVAIQNRAWNSVTVAWDPVEGASAYQVEVDGADNCHKTKDCSYTLRGLVPREEHKFRVRTVQKKEMSEWSDVVVGRTEDEYPDFSGCVWMGPEEGAVYKLDEGNKRIATKTQNSQMGMGGMPQVVRMSRFGGSAPCKVFGTVPLPINKVVSWNVKMLNVEVTGGGYNCILVGIAPIGDRPNEDIHTAFLDYSTLSVQNSTGVPVGRRIDRNRSLRTGDVVGVTVDTTRGEISFIVNGVDLGIVRSRIPFDKPIVPCVVLFGEGDSVELDLSEAKENVDRSIPVPSNVREKSVTWDSVTLTWDAVEGAVFYQVEVDGVLQKSMCKECTFTNDGFLGESEHNLRVRAARENSVSEWSDVIMTRTLKTPDLSECVWKEFTGDGFEGRYVVDKANPRIVTSTEGTPCIFGSAPLPLNRICSWNVKLLNIQNGSVSSIGVSLHRRDKRGIDESGWCIGCTDLGLITKFGAGLERGDSNQWPWMRSQAVKPGDIVGVVVDTAKGELSFVLNGVNLGVAYEGIPLDKPLVPCAILRTGDSVELDTSEVKENVDDTIGVPAGIEVKTESWDTITLTWGSVEGASVYQVEVDGNSIRSVASRSKSIFTVRGLLPETEHSFRMRAVKEYNAGAWSDVVKMRTQKTPGFSECVWKKCPEYVCWINKYSVDAKNPRIASMTDNGSCTIIGNTLLPLNTVTSWSIKVLKSRDNNGSKIYIGVAPVDINQDWWDNYDKCGWYFDCYESTLYSGLPHDYVYKSYGSRKKKGEYVHTGDSVGVVMDTARGELSFVLNGVNFGVAYEGIPLDKPLVPCVLLKNKDDSVELVI